MDLLLEGILIAIMMAIILIFVVYEYSVFFAPKTSIDYYNTFVGMTSSACTSIQSASNVQFSSPEIFVFQFYDNSSCNSVLSSNSNIFSPKSSALSSLEGGYALCYANVSNPAAIGISSGNQYYFQQSSADNINFNLLKENQIPNSGNLSYDAINNQILTSGVEVNSSSSFSLILNPKTQINPSDYTFDIDQYSNTTVNMQVYFNGLPTCSLGYSDESGTVSLSIVPPCQENINNITIEITPVTAGPFYYQINLTAVSDSNQAQKFLFQQCTKLPSLVSEGAISTGSIVCMPISCGGHSFMLTDQSNRPFLGLYGGSYTFFGVQSGVNDLQIVNSYPEQLLSSSTIDRTVFEETGLFSDFSWSVTYNRKTESSKINSSGGGNTLMFSVPSGSYSFSVPNSHGTIYEGHSAVSLTMCPNPSSGSAAQGQFVSINFSTSC